MMVAERRQWFSLGAEPQPFSRCRPLDQMEEPERDLFLGALMANSCSSAPIRCAQIGSCGEMISDVPVVLAYFDEYGLKADENAAMVDGTPACVGAALLPAWRNFQRMSPWRRVYIPAEEMRSAFGFCNIWIPPRDKFSYLVFLFAVNVLICSVERRM